MNSPRDYQTPRRIDLVHRGHAVVHEHRATGSSSPNPGTSALAVLARDRRQFFTGGGDGTIRI